MTDATPKTQEEVYTLAREVVAGSPYNNVFTGYFNQAHDLLKDIKEDLAKKTNHLYPMAPIDVRPVNPMFDYLLMVVDPETQELLQSEGGGFIIESDDEKAAKMGLIKGDYLLNGVVIRAKKGN